MDVDADILIEDTVSYMVFATIQKVADLVEAILYVIAVLDFYHYCSGIKSLKCHWVRSLNIAIMSLNAHCAQPLKYCDRVADAPIITQEFLKCGD